MRFQFKPEKFVNAVAYLAQACPNSTKMSICKLLYYADKKHLTEFGRPILGDHYYKLAHGPIPTRGLDMLRRRASPEENALFEKFITVIGNSVHPKQPANRRVFSRSDLRALDWAIQEYGRASAIALRNRTHTEAPWTQTEDGCAIDYALFFDDDHESQEVKALAEAEQESRDLFRAYAPRQA
ncbi:MAG: Panacea domain-containing protein [Bryobacteraceae bacterium]